MTVLDQWVLTTLLHENHTPSSGVKYHPSLPVGSMGQEPSQENPVSALRCLETQLEDMKLEKPDLMARS